MAEFVLRSTRRLYRGQAAALIGGTLVPAALNVAYLTGNFDLGITPVGLAVSVALFAFAAVRYRLGNVTPIAREKVIDTVRDGMLVVDTESQVTDSNPAANWMIGAEESPIGRPVSAVLADVPELLAAYEEMTAAGGESKRTVTYGGQFIEVRATPITDDRGRQIEWTLLLQDVSERVRRERDLEEQIEKLDQFASIVSHDLRNPINVARGYIQQTQATGDIDNLDKSLEAVDRMDAIIEDVLALTRGGEEVTEPRPVSLPSLARETWGVLDTGAADLEVVDDTMIVADPDRLRRLFENLFRNSIEHGVEPTADDESFAADHRHGRCPRGGRQRCDRLRCRQRCRSSARPPRPGLRGRLHDRRHRPRTHDCRTDCRCTRLGSRTDREPRGWRVVRTLRRRNARARNAVNGWAFALHVDRVVQQLTVRRAGGRCRPRC
jgi:PAS domain S-box-containing protein